jgi:hemoglobin-like flavoprotein
MNAQQITLVQDSFSLVAPIADLAADLFYIRLFQLDPSLKSMFKGDIYEQKYKLMSMLTVVVNSLTRPRELLPVVQALGRRHAVYGVEARHYDTVGVALLWTLEQGLGDAFTPEVEAAWVAVYSLLATTMQQASAEMAMPINSRAGF